MPLLCVVALARGFPLPASHALIKGILGILNIAYYGTGPITSVTTV